MEALVNVPSNNSEPPRNGQTNDTSLFNINKDAQSIFIQPQTDSSPKAPTTNSIQGDQADIDDLANDLGQMQLSESANSFYGPSSTYRYFKVSVLIFVSLNQYRHSISKDAVEAREGYIKKKHPELDRELQNQKRMEFWGSPPMASVC